MKEIYITSSVEETELLGASFARELVEAYDGECIFVAMYGDLGAGKTAFVRGFASVISPNSAVRSPTYTIVNEYRKDNINGISLYHFDMYRITDEDELYSIGFFDYIKNGGICIAEWCENIKPCIPYDLGIKTVTIEKFLDDENKRKINFA